MCTFAHRYSLNKGLKPTPMQSFRSKINPKSDRFLRNKEEMQVLIDELHAHLTVAKTEGMLEERWDYIMYTASAIVDGNYKVLVNLQTYESRLFDVVVDPGENNDLSFEMVEKKSNLLNRLNDYLKEVDAEKIEDMFQVRLDELAKRIEFHREKGNNQMMTNDQRQFDYISKARENKSWRK
jgi:hypothetical protein